MDAALLVLCVALGQVAPVNQVPEVILDHRVDAVEISNVVEEGYDKLTWFDGEETWVYAPQFQATYIAFWRAGHEGQIISDGCFVLTQKRALFSLNEEGGGEVVIWPFSSYDLDRRRSIWYGVRVKFRRFFTSQRCDHPLEGVPRENRWRLPTP